MAKTANEVFRDFVRFTGDGLPGAPVGHPLPVGDPASGVHDPSKRDIRELLQGILDFSGDAGTVAGALAAEKEARIAGDADVVARIDPVATAVANLRALLKLSQIADPRDDLDPEWAVVWPDIEGHATGVDDRGVTHQSGITIYPPGSFELPDRDLIGDYLPLISVGSRMLLGLDADGEVIMPGAGGGYTPPSLMRGDWGQFNVRGGGTTVYATVRDAAPDVYDIEQFAEGPDTAVISSSLPIELVVGYGQSNAGAVTGEDDPLKPTIFEEGSLPHRVLSLQQDGAPGGTSSPATGYGDLYPAPDRTRGQSPVACMMHALARYDSAAGRRGLAYATTNVWLGGRPISDFFPNGGQYLAENLLSWTGALKAAAAKYRAARLTAVLWTQGENTTANYQADLERLIDTLRPSLRDTAGQADLPHWLMRQTSRSSNEVGPDANGVALAQLAVARARLGNGVSMTGPMYQAPLWDTIHVTNLGRLLLAEVDALAYERVVRLGQNWHPLWPVAGGVTRAGAVIRVPFELPPGASALAWDDDWIAAVANRGFHYTDSGSGATIKTVAIDGTDVVITLSADPGAATDKRISYARRGLTRLDGWASTRGQLYARTSRQSPFAQQGYPLPPTVRLYAVQFEETIS